MTGRRKIHFSTDRDAARFSRAVAVSSLVRLARGVFADDTSTPVEAQFREHVWEIVAHLIPDALVADHTATLGGRLTQDGLLFIQRSARRTDLTLPGIRAIVPLGPGPRPDDLPWFHGLRRTSPARTLVDHLAPSRTRVGSSPRTLSPAELEEWVVRQARTDSTDAEREGVALRLPSDLTIH